MPLLHVERHGRILDQEAREILGFLEECYGRVRFVPSSRTRKPDRMNIGRPGPSEAARMTGATLSNLS
jgi:hypothetical protein